MIKSRFTIVTFILIAALALTSFQTLAGQGHNLSQLFSPASPLAPDVPNPFSKLSPVNNATGQSITSLTLQWSPSSTPNVTYEYCIRSNKPECPGPKWISAGGNTSVTISGLTPNLRYYWQVRAVDATGVTEADGNQWWQFTTLLNANLPGPFSKLSPLDAATNQPVNGVALSWSASSLATSYQYCYDTNNNNTCDSTWTSETGLTAALNGLAYDTNYYWQVRAVNATGNVQADAGTWFSFRTQIAPPGAFGKLAPANFAIDQPLSLTLSWGASAGTGISYEYCLDTAPCYTGSSWTPAGTALSAGVSGLLSETNYYWQVRAINSVGTTYADGAESWRFTTPVGLPGSFNKTSPVNNAVSQPLSLSLTWGASSGTNVRYEYCLSTATCTPASTWQLAGTNTSASLSGLAFATTYYWQVRAVNSAGMTYANGGTVWQFNTINAPPQPFSKLSPANAGAGAVPVNVGLQWSPSTGASRYFYCVDTVSHASGDATCGTGWVLANTTTTNPLNLAYNQTYYWQVYAENPQGTVQADSGVWWSFTTLIAAPAYFTKVVPANNAIDQALTPWLYWATPTDPSNTYQYCLDTAADCPSGGWTAVAENAPIQVATPLAHNTLYYWQVRATNLSGTTYANNAEWTFTTIQSPPTSSNQAFSTAEDTPLNDTLTATSNYAKVFALYGSTPAGTLNLSSSGAFVYTPVDDFSGTVTFQFVVSDGYNPPVGPYTATITVTPLNDPPSLVAIPNQQATAGSQVTFWALASDPDLPYGDTLTYSIDEVLPAGASINPLTGLFRWPVPASQLNSVFVFTVRVTDNGSSSATRVVTITVVEKPRLLLPFINR
jgi:hypothetical protein